MIYFIIIVLIILFVPLAYMVFLMVFEFRPNEVEELTVNGNNKSIVSNEFSVITFNIGYCSLDKDNDFFFDGGINSRAISKEIVIRNLEGVSSIIEDINADFYLIQEIDESGSRSYNVNQLDHIVSNFPRYNSSFAFNYRLKYLWYPFKQPMGSAYGGLLTLSKHEIESSLRHKLKGEESFPRRLFFLKRCMVVNTIKTKNNKLLYMINIHLSAYDTNGDIRKQQANYLIDFLDSLYNEDLNYIVVGGDWNHLLQKDLYTDDMPQWVSLLPDNIYQNKYRLVFDSSVNSVRSLEKAYKKGKNFETVIDGFLVSPNIETMSVKTVNYEFKHSDHNPVMATFRLK